MKRRKDCTGKLEKELRERAQNWRIRKIEKRMGKKYEGRDRGERGRGVTEERFGCGREDKEDIVLLHEKQG